jgi:hypothetical protein
MRTSLIFGFGFATVLGLTSGAIAQDDPIGTPGATDKFYVEKNCQVTTKSDGTARLQQRFPLKIDGGEYQFYTGMYGDGGAIACLAQRDLTEAQVLKLPFTQHFIDGIKSDPKVKNAYVVRVREGNGMEVPITNWGVIFQTMQPESINLNLLRQSGRLTGNAVTHKLAGKAGKAVTIVLDSRVQAGFVLLNSKGVRVATGLRDKKIKSMAETTLTLPANDTYQLVVTAPKGKQGSYTLSVNANQLP